MINWYCVDSTVELHADFSDLLIILMSCWPLWLLHLFVIVRLLCDVAVIKGSVQWKGRHCCPSYARFSRWTWKVIWWLCWVLPSVSSRAYLTTSAALQSWSKMLKWYCANCSCSMADDVSLLSSYSSVVEITVYVTADWYLHSVLLHCWLGIRKSIRPVKNWLTRCWRGYVSGARHKWFAYGLANATATPSCLDSLV